MIHVRYLAQSLGQSELLTDRVVKISESWIILGLWGGYCMLNVSLCLNL